MSSFNKSYSIACVIPTHNRKRELDVLLDQISKQKNVANINIDIIVVVDGSTDGTLEMLRSTYPDVHIVQGDGSWWYTKSLNEGFKYAVTHMKPDFLLTMNDDTEIKENYLESIVKSYEQVENGSIVGSVSFTKSNPKRIMSSGKTFKNKFFGLFKSNLPEFTTVNPNDFKGKIFPSIVLPGRGMLIPSETLKKLNLFDESFKQYHSDEDFCLRARNEGFKVYISWDAHIYVHEKLTGTGTSFLSEDLSTFCSNFFKSTSRLYLPDKSRMYWRHKKKLLWPLNLVIFLIVSFKNFFFKSKL